MRFCPFCVAENVVEAATCVQCGRRLPPPPTRKRAPGAAGGAAPGSAAPAPASGAVTVPTRDDERRALRTGLLPPPTAARRKSATAEVRPAGSDARRRGDVIGEATRTTVAAPPAPPPPAGPEPPPPVEATRPIDASWLIEATGVGDDLGELAPPPSPSPSAGPAGAEVGDDTHTRTRVAGDPAAPAAPADPAADATRTAVAIGAAPADVTHTTVSAAPPAPPVDPARRRSTTLPPLDAAPPRRKASTLPPPLPAASSSGAVASAASSSGAAAPGAAAAPAAGVPLPPKLPPAPATPSATKLPGRDATSLDPPPTRIVREEALVDRPFTPPQVLPIPPVPDPGPVNLARYAITFGRARWQRRRAVKVLQAEINGDTEALDGVLLQLGRDARGLGVDNRVLAAENQAIDDAEARRDQMVQQGQEIGGRKLEETARYEELERERTIKVTEAEKVLEEAQRELSNLEAQRRGIRDKRKELERRQNAYLKTAEQRDAEAGNAPLGEARSELRRMADGHRREAASLDPERQEQERRLAALDRPIAAAQTRVEEARAEVDQQRRSLADAREGHRHRLAELDAEAARKAREKELIEGEINRRLVNLGTLINLHRVERPEFGDLYGRIDRLRHAINARTTEIDRLTAERDAYDRGSLLRGCAVLAGIGVLLITFLVIILALV